MHSRDCEEKNMRLRNESWYSWSYNYYYLISNLFQSGSGPWWKQRVMCRSFSFDIALYSAIVYAMTGSCNWSTMGSQENNGCYHVLLCAYDTIISWSWENKYNWSHCPRKSLKINCFPYGIWEPHYWLMRNCVSFSTSYPKIPKMMNYHCSYLKFKTLRFLISLWY